MDYPIVFIPGLFGSMGDDIIKGTGEFSFGFAERVYRPFIRVLNSMGYIEGVNLFISYYDWRKPVLESVDKYLIPTIETAKSITSMEKVILIGHSLGGLVGRVYGAYLHPDTVYQLILIGTPNLGSVNAYYFWSGGKLPYSKVENNILYNGLRLGFVLYYKLFHDISYIEALREMFPVGKDLLPSYRYGNYLYYNRNGRKIDIPIEDMSVKNEFLNRLEKQHIENNNLYVISGTGVSTNRKFIVKRRKNHIKWADGKPIKDIKTVMGDGTVTLDSSRAYLGENNMVLEGSHTGILFKSKDAIGEILGKTMTMEVREENIEKVYFILTDQLKDINISSDHMQSIIVPHGKQLIMVTEDRDSDFQLAMDKGLSIEGKDIIAVIDKEGVHVLNCKK